MTSQADIYGCLKDAFINFSQNFNEFSWIFRMSKKYMPRPPYCFGEIPEYTIPPMTVEEYRNYEKEFFGFLDDKPCNTDVQNESGFVERFLKFFGVSKISKYEDGVPEIQFNVHHVLRNNADSRLGGTGDILPSEMVRQENKATQTEDVVKCDQEIQTIKPKRVIFKSFRRFFGRCLKTEE
ncbi:hypothetical protein LOTGIDRAFT_154799 [Lottia gigantea]|uniref:Uncharacterized protein n=1 Tax=Lottia gigantea TaxID=225164 RepID=V4A1X2_LOTGI|nr:hypothetical protein LOTGIDRAFT_154799 [Lottia gigantea]ESO87301.1 hypothetical protein LOTGIDRAFT_154799 [Lottia gigantea]